MDERAENHLLAQLMETFSSVGTFDLKVTKIDILHDERLPSCIEIKQILVVKVGSFPESIAFIKETVFAILCAPKSTHRMFFILFGQLSAD